MPKILISLLLIISLEFFSQQSAIKIKKEKQSQTLALSDRPAFFKDSSNIDGIFIDDFIQRNIQLPDSEIKNQVLGKVFLTFTVKENGELTNIKVVKGLNGCVLCDKEAVRLFSTMPKWNPAVINNKPLATTRNWTLVFTSEK